MNRVLAHYCVDVRHPEVSGAEHLEMLKIRDRLVASEPTLTPEEKLRLAEADQALAQQAAVFYEELSRFLNLAEQRQTDGIPPLRWWWYLDVVRYVPRRGGIAHVLEDKDQDGKPSILS